MSTLPTPASNAPNQGQGDQAYMLIMTALVQIMTPGVAFFYGGLVGEHAVVNAMMLSFGSMAVVTVLWSLIGYSMAFGPVAIGGTGDPGYTNWHASDASPQATLKTAVIGNGQLAVQQFMDQLRQSGWTNSNGATTWTDPNAIATFFNVTEHVYCQFQLMFAIITAALISGSVIGKIKYVWFMLFVAIWHLTVYCPLAHWIFFYDGWLNTMGVLDYAGGMVVHASSGVSALVLTFWLGKSKKRGDQDDAHSIPYVLLGASLLWFGWFGFNAGSAIGASTNVSARVFSNTQLATAMAMMQWGVMEMIFGGDVLFSGRPSAVGAATGAVIGLVAITPACGYVTQMWALFIGFFTVIVCYFAPRLTKLCGIDDRLDCFAFHGVGGLCGALLTGLFASVDYGASGVNGAWYGNPKQFGIQIAGCLVTVLLSVVGTTVIFWVLQLAAWALKTDLRIPEEHAGELDVSQHGEKAYYRATRHHATQAQGEAGAPKNVAWVDDSIALKKSVATVDEGERTTSAVVVESA